MIRIICVGRIKEKFYNDAILEYKKRLSKYTRLEIVEIGDESFDIKTTLKKESEKILKVMRDSDYNIVLDINGDMVDSVTLSNKLNTLLQTNSNITFIIGGSYGLSEDVKAKCQYALSFSKLTFPHQLFRVIMLEQLYRSFKILNNEEYHK